MLRGTEPASGTEYFTDAFGREACDFIERHKGKPWFLYLAFNAVHTPMHATDERLAKFAGIPDKMRQTYAAMMFAMDENIGRVRKKLADTGQEENTLVAFISDNGGPCMPGVTVNGSVNDPLRGSKRTTLEGGIRVPFLLSWKNHVKSGVFEKPVIQLDLTATALALAGARADNLDGLNLLPFLSGEKTAAPHEALYWRFGEQMAIRVGDFKLVRYDSNVETRTGKRNQPVAGPSSTTGERHWGNQRPLRRPAGKGEGTPGQVGRLECHLKQPLWSFARSDSDGDPKSGKKKKKK